ncbi:hypothetical protein KPL78_23345 [Roseomonas sp. HJA6]|uniref:DUF2007 domain-containing protein n=1 Tax=Roseomonas alba TaxID=2846776 RepID=A0ABS7AET1_9PROT|nr:hypothetical protein [Neoroseomonas alba]MBW6400816.1 hypothetical protein [Neoroseomonas alba]
MYIRLRIVEHPEGRRRLVLLMREDGLYTVIEEELRGGLAEAAGPQGWVVDEHSLVAGVCGTSDDAMDDAMKWFEGYRTLH